MAEEDDISSSENEEEEEEKGASMSLPAQDAPETVEEDEEDWESPEFQAKYKEAITQASLLGARARAQVNPPFSLFFCFQACLKLTLVHRSLKRLD